MAFGAEYCCKKTVVVATRGCTLDVDDEAKVWLAYLRLTTREQWTNDGEQLNQNCIAVVDRAACMKEDIERTSDISFQIFFE